MAIELKNVSYTYMQDTVFSHAAISEINLTVTEKEFVAIIGHTGSGKSTLITHMNGLLQPTVGKVYVDGMDMSDKKLRKKGRSLVGMVFQYPEHQLFEETVAKDIAFGPRNMGCNDDEIDVRVRNSMELVGLDYDEFAEKSPFDLSGGEKRRAALAGIIAMRPKYLVMDEPMAGLDPAGRESVLKTIKSLKDALGCTIVMVSHSMDDVALAAGRIIVLNDGKIEMDGSPQEVFMNVDRLIDIGLDIPQPLMVVRNLRNRGVQIPDGILDIDALCDFLSKGLGLC